MITYTIMAVLLALVVLVLAPFPAVTAFPFVATSSLVTYMGYIKAFNDVFWPLVPLVVIMFWYILWRLLMVGLRFFLGARMPRSTD